MFKDCGSFYMRVPEGYTGPLDAVIYYPSNTPDMGNEGAETYPFEAYAAANPDKIVIINKEIYYDSDAVYETLSEMNNSGEVQVGLIDIFTHSKTDTAGIKSAIAADNFGFQVAHNSSLDSNGSLSRFNTRRDGEIVDYNDNGVPIRINALSHEEINAFADTGSMLVLFEQSGSGKSQLNEFINQLEPGKEVPMMYITCKLPGAPDDAAWNRNHKSMVLDPINGGYIDALNGTGSLSLEGGRIKSYSFEMYDYSTHDWKSYTQDEAEQILASYGQSLRDYLPSALPSSIDTGKLVNISADGIRINLEAAVGNLPSRDDLLVYKDELSAFLNSSMLAALATDASDSSNLINLINNFISNSILKGESWNIAYEKLGVYNEKLNERIMAANELGETLRSAVSALLGCMTEYDVIDTSKLEELKEEVHRLEESIADLNTRLYKYEEYTDEHGNSGTRKVKDEGVQDQIDALEEQKREIEKYIAAIEKLQATYDGVKPTLEAALAKVSAFSGEIASITPSPAYSYVA